MRDICLSLREENKLPDDLDDEMGGLCHLITDDFNSDVFVDEQAKEKEVRVTPIGSKT